MQFKKILLAATAALTLTSAAAMAAPTHNPDQPFQIVDARWDRDHDRFDRDHGRWNRGDQRFVPNDRVFRELRMRHIRYVGTPYFYHGQYVVRAYDYRGNLVFVRVNPYTGNFLGISIRL